MSIVEGVRGKHRLAGQDDCMDLYPLLSHYTRILYLERNAGFLIREKGAECVL